MELPHTIETHKTAILLPNKNVASRALSQICCRPMTDFCCHSSTASVKCHQPRFLCFLTFLQRDTKHKAPQQLSNCSKLQSGSCRFSHLLILPFLGSIGQVFLRPAPVQLAQAEMMLTCSQMRYNL